MKGKVKMEMTDNEIYRNWKESKNPSAQVKVLAELNGCDPDKISAIIRKVDGDQAVPVSDSMNERIIELYNSGMSYKEMATTLAVSKSTVTSRLKMLADSGKITRCKVTLPDGKTPTLAPAQSEPVPEPADERANQKLKIPAGDMMQWLDILRALTNYVASDVTIESLNVQKDESAEVSFSVDSKEYWIRIEVQ